MPPFFGIGPFTTFFAAIVGRFLVMVELPLERKDDGSGENPCTMLPDLIIPSDEALVSEHLCVLSRSMSNVSAVVFVAVEMHEDSTVLLDDGCSLCVDPGDSCRLSQSFSGDILATTASSVSRSNGSRALCSWIFVMIFSSLRGVKCGSFPLDLLNAESSRLLFTESASLYDPSELDKEGTSSLCGRGISMAGTIVWSG